MGALRKGLNELTELLDAVRDAWARVKPDASSSDLAEALALAQKLQPLLPDRLSLLDRESGRSLQLDQLVAERNAAERARDKAVERTVYWRERLTPADTRTALVQARRFDAQFFLFRWLSPAWWALRGLLRKRYLFGKHAVQPSYSDVLEGLSDEHATHEAVAAIDERARDLLRFEGELPAFAAKIAALRDAAARLTIAEDNYFRGGKSPLVVIGAPKGAGSAALLAEQLVAFDLIASDLQSKITKLLALSNSGNSFAGVARAAVLRELAKEMKDDDSIKGDAFKKKNRDKTRVAAFFRTALAKSGAERRNLLLFYPDLDQAKKDATSWIEMRRAYIRVTLNPLEKAYKKEVK
jgi:hypothetical protein